MPGSGHSIKANTETPLLMLFKKTNAATGRDSALTTTDEETAEKGW